MRRLAGIPGGRKGFGRRHGGDRPLQENPPHGDQAWFQFVREPVGTAGNNEARSCPACRPRHFASLPERCGHGHACSILPVICPEACTSPHAETDTTVSTSSGRPCSVVTVRPATVAASTRKRSDGNEKRRLHGGSPSWQTCNLDFESWLQFVRDGGTLRYLAGILVQLAKRVPPLLALTETDMKRACRTEVSMSLHPTIARVTDRIRARSETTRGPILSGWARPCRTARSARI
jgi:hypothetical protein